MNPRPPLSARLLLALLAATLATIVGGCSDPKPTAAPKLSPAAANRIRGQQFLAENAKKPGVLVTASGLQYKVLQEGDGLSPKTTEIASVHFRGALIDGSEFDSSRGPDGMERAVPLPLNQIIRGLSEGLQLARVGGSYDFYIPSQLAYGLEHAPDKIGPNQCLIFHIDLLAIMPRDQLK